MAYRKTDKNLPQILMNHLKEAADNDGYVEFNCSSFGSEHDVSGGTVNRLVNDLAQRGKLEYTRLGSKGYLVHVLGSRRIVNLRKCPKCGEIAPDEKSRFCHRCGASLLSEKEQLKERLNTLRPKLFREIQDSRVANELGEILAHLEKLAFKED